MIVVSIHWGPNWGYDIPEEQRHFAHTLIERADVSVIHGHSSHHAKGIEIYRDRLILYGCGDFLNDYEGIQGYEDYRGDLALMYFADIEPATRTLSAVEIVPLQIHKFSLVRPSGPDIDWVRQTLDRESRKFGTSVAVISPGRLALSWSSIALERLMSASSGGLGRSVRLYQLSKIRFTTVSQNHLADGVTQLQ